MLFSVIFSNAAGPAAAGVLTELKLTADPANSSPSSFGGSLAATLNDGFAYDPMNPTGVLPDQIYDQIYNANGFHANAQNATSVNLSYTLTNGPLTLTGNLNVDFYGRSDFSFHYDRDNDIDIQLFNGDYATPVATLTGGAIPDAPPLHFRATVPLVSTTFDRLRVIGNDSADSRNYFTLMEIRANTQSTATGVIPEPTSMAIFAVGAGALGFGRRRSRTVLRTTR